MSSLTGGYLVRCIIVVTAPRLVPWPHEMRVWDRDTRGTPERAWPSRIGTVRRSRVGSLPFTRGVGVISLQLTAVNARATAAIWPLIGGFSAGIKD